MKKIGFIGMGNMAGAILLGALANGYLNGDDVIVYDINAKQYDKLKDYNCGIANDLKDLVINSDMVLLGVKPIFVNDVLSEVKDVLTDKSLISIVLGYDFKKCNEVLCSSTRHVSVMPNTPALVGEGMTLIEATHSLMDDEFEFVEGLFKAVGEIEILPSYLMSAAGSLTGCGPAFIYMVIEALADGAVLEGVPRELAYRLASQMVLGSGKMQKVTKTHPGILKDNVCSPGGVTIKGVSTLEKGGMRSLFMDAISSTIIKK